MTTIKLPSLPVVATGNAPLDRWLSAVNQIVRSREGMGGALDRLVTMRDLAESNVAQLTINGQPTNAYLGAQIPELPGGVLVKQIDYTPPPALTGLSASGALQNIIVSWDLPLNSNYAHTEVWRATSSNIGSAVKIGTSASTVYVDAIGISSTVRYYWVRQVSEAGVIGPFNSTTGTGAFTAKIGATDIGPNSISTGMLQANSVIADKIAASQITAGKIATNAVTADKIIANAIIASKIASDQVNATHMAANSITAANAAIANLAVTNAKIANLAVTEGKIANLAVDTLKIADQAVTIPVSVYTSGTILPIGTSWTTVQSASIVSTGNPIHISFSCILWGSTLASTNVRMRIRRGGQNLWLDETIQFTEIDGDIQLGTVSIAFVNTPGSGSHTYLIQMIGPTNSSLSGASASRRTLLLLEVKK